MKDMQLMSDQTSSLSGSSGPLGTGNPKNTDLPGSNSSSGGMSFPSTSIQSQNSDVASNTSTQTTNSATVPLAQLAQKLSSWKGGMMNEPMPQTISSNATISAQGSDRANVPSPVSSVESHGLENSGMAQINSSDSTFSSGASAQISSAQTSPVAELNTPSIPQPPSNSGPVPGMPAGYQSGGPTFTVPQPMAPNTAPSNTVGAIAGQPAAAGGLKQEVPVSASGPVVIRGSAVGKMYPYTIEDLLQLVVDKNASDLHITTNYPAMLRIDGSLVPVGSEIITDEIVNDIVLPVLPESKQELLEVNREVDLAYSFKGLARFRINAFYAKGTVSAAFRLIPNKIRNIEELRLPATYHQLTRLPQGLVLVTGPTGHGKSTTLAAIIQEINENYPKHIITIEDPIEYVYPKARALVAQREMHEDTHSWEIALRSAMREDPNVILVGEMRDYETIAAAITLAETGHLVFATLHTNSAAQTIDRIIDVFPEHQQPQVRMQVSVILEAIISQRLIPVNSGGRRAVSEVLFATGAVRNLIREGKTHQVDNVIRTSLDVGMKTLEHSLVELVREGDLSIEEAESVALHPEELVRLLRV